MIKTVDEKHYSKVLISLVLMKKKQKALTYSFL